MLMPTYCMRIEGEYEGLYDLDELVDLDMSATAVAAVSALAPGQTHAMTVRYDDRPMRVTFTRVRRMRVTVAYEIDCVDDDDAARVVETLLDNGVPQDQINAAAGDCPEDYEPMHVATVEVESVKEVT
jgi:hypothetical protein